MDPDNAPDRLELADVAARLGLTTEGVRKRIKRGQLLADKVDGRWLVVWPPPDKPDTDQPTEPTNRTDNGQGVPELVGLVERLHREVYELSGRVGFLQAQLQAAQDQIRLLAAPAENGGTVPPLTEQPAAETTPITVPPPNALDSGAERPLKPWWAALWPWGRRAV